MATTTDAYDAAPGNGLCQGVLGFPCSLRAAIQEANALAGPDVITLPAGTYNLTRSGAGEDSASTGDLDITSDLTINGAGAATTIIDAGDLDRVFHVLSGTVSISGVTIRNGNLGGDGGGIYNSGILELTNSTVSDNTAGDGGGIYNYYGNVTLTNSTVSGNGATNGAGIRNLGTLTLTNSTVSDNTAGDGGGIFNSGTLTLTNSTVSGNTAGREGGGIYNYHNLTLTNSTVSGNSANYSGGGIYNNGALTLTNSTVSGNTASGGGGGIHNSLPMWPYAPSAGNVTLTNSTVSGNRANYSGGGISNYHNLTLTNSTITSNTADWDANGTGDGGGIVGASAVSLKNTIVAGNFDLSSVTVDPDCAETLSSQGHNLIQTVSPGCTVTGDTTGNVIGQDANLGSLANNGGPTQTHAILADSPAIDAGSSDCPPPATDQRGVGRPLGSGCDIGAYESSFVSTPPGDSDGDGWTDEAEAWFGTNPNVACGFTSGGDPASENWPADLFESDNINTTDVLQLRPVFGQPVPPASARYDLFPSGNINTTDVLQLKPQFGGVCTP
ncbi:MAG TPA: choice-of-anchor Q domain-containing protein [Dehalococcoidia bacterium]|nr:choice-of-anchor Q domain-containing protein [Dehalococcoidia bacterium]